VIRVENLFKQYDRGLVKALNGISLHIPKGEVCSIMGPSGCGKSTLLNVIGALDVPTSGKIYIDTLLLKNHRPMANYRNRYIGFIFQFHNLIPNITLVENIELPTYANPSMMPRPRREKAMMLLSEVELESRAHHFPTQVSGGERQRVAVARALINSPKILLADEPTGSVDSTTAAFIMEAILRRCRNDGMTALVVSHDVNIASLTDRRLSMRDGAMEDCLP
jgi:putative ABC transport system ATP-binding protein